MTSSAFIIIDKNEWALSLNTPAECRRLLHRAQPFEAVIQELCKGIRVIAVHRNRARSLSGYFRAHVVLKVPRDACAAFHSGRSGYRAQYYRSIAGGERANDFAVSSITDAIESQLRDTSLMNKEWIRKSLLGPNSKVWIHQGQWLRQSRHRDRLLLVERWMNVLRGDEKKARKLARWGSLVPQAEDAIEIKGTFLTVDGRASAVNPKPERSMHLHELGYT